MLAEQPQHISLIKVQCPFPPFNLRQKKSGGERTAPCGTPLVVRQLCASTDNNENQRTLHGLSKSPLSVLRGARLPARTLARTHELSVMNSVCTHTVIHSNIISCIRMFLFFFVFWCLLHFHYRCFLLISFFFSCRDHFFLFYLLRAPATVCLHEVNRFNLCISETVVFVHCAITFRATSLFVCPFLCTSGRKPRVFYTVSIYNLATIRRRRSQQGIYNGDAGHISWPFVRVLGASSFVRLGNRGTTFYRTALTHLEQRCEGRIATEAMWRLLDAMSVTKYTVASHSTVLLTI